MGRQTFHNALPTTLLTSHHPALVIVNVNILLVTPQPRHHCVVATLSLRHSYAFLHFHCRLLLTLTSRLSFDYN